MVHETTLSSAGTVLHNVGGVKCQPFKKIVTTGNRLKKSYKMDCVLWFLFIVQSSGDSATTVAKEVYT